MIDPKTIKGLIFDVDDTLLDNQHEIGTLHEISRYDAILRTARKYNLKTLATLTHDENFDTFMNAKVHSLEGAVWGALRLKGVVDSDEVDYDLPILKEIVALKEELHADILRTYGRPVKDAVAFVHHWNDLGFGDRMAIASTAYRRDIDIFLDEMTDLRQFFPQKRVISKEMVLPGQAKPHPHLFNRAFATLGLSDEDRPNILAFEDDPRGVMSARSAGLYTCAITTRYPADDPQLVAARPDMIINSFEELMNSMKRHA